MTPDRIDELARLAERLEPSENENLCCAGTRHVWQARLSEALAALRAADRAALDHFQANGTAYQLGVAAGQQGLAGKLFPPPPAIGDVVQIVPTHHCLGGALALVTELRSWGIVADVPIRGRGVAPVRLTPEEYRWIGPAGWVAAEATSEPSAPPPYPGPCDLGGPYDPCHDPECPEHGPPAKDGPEPDWSGLRDADPNVHRRAADRARSDWRDGQQAISWLRGRVAHLESELGSEREATVPLDLVVAHVERTTAAAFGLRDELIRARSDLASLVSALPRCQHCPNPATYAWHGGDELACDAHTPPERRADTGAALPYAARLRAPPGRP